MSETAIVGDVLDALAAMGVWAWRVNAGVFGARHIRGAPAGTPDVLGVLPGGLLFGIEVKDRKGKQEASQRAWQSKAERFGVRYGIARSAREAVELVKEWRRKERNDG